MGPDMEAGRIIDRLQGSKQFKEVVERLLLTPDGALGTFHARKLSEHLGDVIGHRSFHDAGTPKDLADENIEIEVGGDAQATAMLEDGAQQDLVVKNEVAAFFVGEKLNQALRVVDLWPQHAKDEVDVFGSELDPAIGLNDVHRLLTQFNRHHYEFH